MILEHLNRVKQTGPNSWLACCPAHGDKTPSLSVRQEDDGRWLIHCFAGCEAHEVLAAIGLSMTDLFPTPIYHRAKPVRSRITASDALKALSREAGVIAVAASDIVEGAEFSKEDADRIARAAGLIATALEVVHG